MTTLQLLFLLILLLLSYALGYWHGSRIGATQAIRTLMDAQHRTTPQGMLRLVRPAARRIAAAVGSAPAQPIPTAEDAHIIDLFLTGMNASGIVARVYGLDMTTGSAYMDRMAYVQAVLRAELQHYQNASSVYNTED